MTGGGDTTGVLALLGACAAVILAAWLMARIDPAVPRWFVPLQARLRAVPAWVFVLVLYALLLADVYLPGEPKRPSPAIVVIVVAAATVVAGFLLRWRDVALTYGLVFLAGLGARVLPLDRDLERFLIPLLAAGLVAWLCDDEEDNEPAAQAA